ncbi:putative protease [Paenibacillus shirakamiensis]|uniref:Protease n=1 Tax=Paenibacillus shirakamiensis TaxID=1265935 RepID=A0ABS4JEL7_9BACL|nr:peptidase U32 family protein [Paenibacillus shirakamiensis]MBP1999034.1 putative protease [Paenibacillus shirakamiensis]
MVKKPELLASAASVQEVVDYIKAGATAVLIGEEKFGTRLPGNVSREDVAVAVKEAHALGAKVYVSLNNLMDNDKLHDLPAYIQFLAEAGVDGVDFGDPAVLRAVRQYAPTMKLHWNAEMTSTNYATANYWGERGASRVVLARELNMDEITNMKPGLKIESEVQVHGMTNIYHSKRSLVRSYMTQQGRPVEGEVLGIDRALFLIEAERKDEKFPIYEDSNGTHIMSSDDICILEDLHMILEAGVDSLKIETILKPTAYNQLVIRIYREAIEAYYNNPEQYEFQEEWMDRIRDVQDPERELSFGFFYKEQVY